MEHVQLSSAANDHVVNGNCNDVSFVTLRRHNEPCYFLADLAGNMLLKITFNVIYFSVTDVLFTWPRK